MSGIVGILHLDGSPVDRRLLGQLTALLSFRGPDAQEIWSEGPVGLGHALLRTGGEGERERQPVSADGRVWIAADARVDERGELIEKLRSRGCPATSTATEAELILQAYRVWGVECVEQLLGDYAFVLWDGGERRLMCARDRFGVKPFYYAQVGATLIVSNTLDCVRAHPQVSGRLNDLAIADFLLFGFNQEPETTSFADIRRLPPAQTLVCSAGTLRMSRYWALPAEGPIRYQRARDYVEQFRALLRVAVSDRLRTDRVGVLMSGGLDSTSVAATAKELLAGHSSPFDLRAYTAISKRSLPDDEGRHAGLVAEALDIPIDYLETADYRLYERWDQPGLRTPEPYDWPLSAINADQYPRVVNHSRVLLCGEGGDVVFYPESGPYVASLLKGLHLARFIADAGRTLLWRRRLPPLGIRSALRSWRGTQPGLPAFPNWLEPALVDRFNLRARWQEIQKPPVANHPLRPTAAGMLSAPFWPYLFGTYDPEMTSVALDVRFPFFDLRLVKYLLSIPPLPWCVDKELLRQAMRGILPQPVLRRPKTALAGDPLLERVQRSDAHWLDHLDPAPELARFVAPGKVPPPAQASDAQQAWFSLRLHSLNFWLRSIPRLPYKSWEEEFREARGAAACQEDL